MTPIAAAPRVIVAGAGPGGLTAAALLREAGAVVTVLERELPGPIAHASRGGLVVNKSVWNVLRQVGGGALLDDARTSVSATNQLMSRRAIVEAVSTHAESIGTKIRHGVEIGHITDDAAGVSVAVRDTQTGADELLRADWFVDASGGHTELSALPEFERHLAAGPKQLLPAERPYVAVEAAADPTRGLGWNGPDGSFVLNNPAEGVLAVYRGGDTLPAAGTLDDVADEMLRSVGVDPKTKVGKPFTFTAKQQVADHAGMGHRLLVGDSVGTVIPATQMGIGLALLDAQRAAKTIVDAHVAQNADDAARIVADYSEKTVQMQKLFIR
jgi:2-polyprenyl-6-methoxyphenol hydroxylase-like FAD-dependent oxidoreductase